MVLKWSAQSQVGAFYRIYYAEARQRLKKETKHRNTKARRKHKLHMHITYNTPYPEKCHYILPLALPKFKIISSTDLTVISNNDNKTSPSHLKRVATLPWEILMSEKNSNSVKLVL